MEIQPGFIVILIISTMAAWNIRRRTRIESFQQDTFEQRYQLPFFAPLSVSYLIFHICLWKTLRSELIYLPSLFSIILSYCTHVSLCYSVLLLLLPLLRKHISSCVCGYLWLVPLIASPLINLGFSNSKPLLLIRTPIQLTRTLVIIWAVGVAGILLWYSISHLYFRRRLLRHAQPVKDPQILELWDYVLKISCFKEPLPRLLCSPKTATPLSIGRKAKRMCVILPQKEYTQEDLRLIFYHELIHTGRADVKTKLYFSILTALLWFNPLMWIALRRITEDMELSCDETTLLCEEDATRHRYAELLLRTAGSHLGFSTCLSASAKSLRYRLKNTLKPAKKASGYIIAGLFCMACLLFQGSVAFAYDMGTGKDCIVSSVSPDVLRNSKMHLYHYYYHSQKWAPPPQQEHQCTDAEALYHYLSELELYRTTGSYHQSWSPAYYNVWINCYTPNNEIEIYMDDYIITTTVYAEDDGYLHVVSRCTYQHSGNIDWEYLLGLFEPYEGGSQESSEDTIPVETQPKEPPALPWHK